MRGLQSKIKILQTVIGISTVIGITVTTVLFIIIEQSPHSSRAKLQSIFVTKPQESCNEDMDRYRCPRTPNNDESNRKDQNDTEVILTESTFNNSEVLGSGEKCAKRLPQAIIVGIQKSGTTALIQFLSDHPQIAACLYPVEPKYFSLRKYKPLEWYRNFMPCSFSNQITIEKSPPYFYSRDCAERIRKMNSKTKIIIVVKDPITRAVSMYAMLKEQKRVMGMSFEDAVSFKTQSLIAENTPYIDFSNYPKYMQAWLDNFKLSQILVVDGHNLEKDPVQELNRVENFLGIDTYFTRDKFTFNETKGKYCLIADENEVQCLNEKKGRDHPEINNHMRDILEKYFRPKNEKFFEMINREFDWGY